MKKEDLIKLGIDEKIVYQIFAIHGRDLEKMKTSISQITTERDALKTQLTEASTTIEGFKKLKPEELQAAADDYKAKYEQATKESATQLANLKFDHALDSALGAAKAKNPKAVKALLSRDLLKLNDADGSIIGLKEQLEAIQKDNDYLFASDAPPPPVIVKGGSSQSVINSDTMLTAARKAAGLKVE
jgi:hypothetical protein